MTPAQTEARRQWLADNDALITANIIRLLERARRYGEPVVDWTTPGNVERVRVVKLGMRGGR